MRQETPREVCRAVMIVETIKPVSTTRFA